MTSSSRARGLRIAFGIALVAAGLLHGTGYTPVTALVSEVSNDAKLILPALWVGYGWHYVALGLGSTHAAYFGYSPSEVMLFGVSAIGAAAAWAHARPPAVAAA